MTQDHTLALLQAALADYVDAEHWLRRSADLCRAIGEKSTFEPEEVDACEALTARYARTIDLLVHKVYRALDVLELESGGSLLDVVHRVEKRGVVDSSDQVRLLKALRNEIVHDYSRKDLPRLFRDSLQASAVLFELGRRVQEYAAMRGWMAAHGLHS